ncbi:MAG: tetratricopeptide repeat protein [Bacteroidales bacterium]|nr:tetratricopeptide repeat protein [Bacteroidales bacterium]MCF8332513.1 tetratricopeptide repeat protein [Bacteroidales bacterium]
MKDSIQKVFLAIVFLLGTSVLVQAQSVDEAGAALNEGISLKKEGKFEEAADQFKKAIDLAEMAGPDALNIEESAKKQLPLMHFKAASEAYKSKNYLEAANKFKKTAEIAQKYNNNSLYKKAARNVPALYNAIANSNRKKKNFEEAHKYFDKAIEFNNKYAKAYLGKLLIYKSLNQEDKMLSTVKKIKEINPNGKSARSAVSSVQTYYLKKAKAKVDEENYAAALDDIKKYNKYGSGNAQGFYLSSVVYNKQRQYEKGAKFAQKALDSEPDKDLKGNVYFELGNAYSGLNKTQQACEAYKKALNGPSSEAAKYQMEEVLECE